MASSDTRARLIWERALEADGLNPKLWHDYATAEARNGFFERARGVWDRAVMALPGVNWLWREYARMEEWLGNVAGERTVFRRWMNWMPALHAWILYVEFELRCNEVERAREVYVRLLRYYPEAQDHVRFAELETEEKEKEEDEETSSRAKKRRRFTNN